MPENSIDIAVVGAGPTGLMAAIALAASGVPVTMIAPPARADHRTTALLASSVTALDTVGVWRTCEAQAAPLRVMRLIDDTGRLLRAPEARFDAREIGLEAFGYNIENNILVAALNARAAELPALRRIDEEADAISCEDDAVRITLRSGKVVGARLIVGADGHRSLCRSAAGIGTNLQDYRQVALTYNVVHERGHQGISTEFHTATGPFTLVPRPGNRSSIVCVVDAAQADRLDGMDAPALARELERRAHSILGKINVETDRGRFPLATEIA
ncbi:MAG: FAD-dependent monooxygenase, partial [Pseudorhodoplanes sp.]